MTPETGIGFRKGSCVDSKCYSVLLRVQKDARRCNGIETSKQIVSRASDEELLARIARGDQDAVKAMVARKLPRLLALAGRMLGDRGDAEDVAQETFVCIWRAAPRWRSGEAKFDTRRKAPQAT
jgi:hypothetical protein